MGEKNVNWHAALDPERPMAIDPLTGGAGGPGPSMFANYRKSQCDGMQNALRVIEETHKDWGDRIGRYYSPLVEEYRLDDAEYALVTIGSMTGAAKDAVDEARARLIERFGLTSSMGGLKNNGTCRKCGTKSTIKYPFENNQVLKDIDINQNTENETVYMWGNDIKSIHIIKKMFEIDNDKT